MKIHTYPIQKRIGLFLLSLMVTSFSYATNYTATTSGNFSSTATWSGGTVPPSTVLFDNITINSGVTVNLDQDVTLFGFGTQLDVEGTLNTNNNSLLTVSIGTLTGSGSISLDTVNINAGATFSFTGSLTANTLNAATSISTSANIMANHSLNLTSGTLSLVTGGKIDAGSNGNIYIAGGLLSLGTGGSVGFTGNYNVIYTSGSSTGGAELTGSGLKNVTIDVNSVGTVTLSSDLTVNGTLTLTSGTLALAGYNLTVHGDVAASGSGTITSTSSTSDIMINGSAGTNGTLNFNAIVNDFTVNSGSGNAAKINGTLSVNGTLQLTSGRLDFSNTTLNINGDVTGSGAVYANSASNLAINTTGGITSSLKFASNGQTINNFTVSVGASTTLALASSLTINGTFDLTNGNISIDNDSLILASSSSLTGNGSIKVTSSSTVIVNSTNDISSLAISGKIKNLTINSGTSLISLGANLEVDNTLSLQNGTFVLNGYNLKVNGNIKRNGNATISATSASDIVITTASSPSSSLKFTTSQNTIGSLKINIANGGTLKVATDLNINDSLKFSNGKLEIDSSTLTVGATGIIWGSKNTSYVITDSQGYLQLSAAASAGTDSVNFPVGTSAHFAPANIHLNSGTPSGQVKVNVMGTVMSNGTTGNDLSSGPSLVAATWDISSTISSSLNMDIQLMWSSAMEVNGFNRNAAFISHFHNGYWDTLTTSSSTTVSGMYSLKRTGLTSLSPFAVFDQNTATPIIDATNNTSQFEIYPNPATENITIQNTTNSTEALNVDVYSSTGKLIGNYTLTGLSSVIPVNDLISGTYVIKFYNSKTNTVKRFTKL